MHDCSCITNSPKISCPCIINFYSMQVQSNYTHMYMYNNYYYNAREDNNCITVCTCTINNYSVHVYIYMLSTLLPPLATLQLLVTLYVSAECILHTFCCLLWPKKFMPSISSCFVFGFASRLINSLSSCQRFSIGLQSGDSAGVFHR